MRYSDPDIERAFSLRSQYERWNEVLFAFLSAQSQSGIFPNEECALSVESAVAAWRQVSIDSNSVSQILVREETTKHDVAAFVEWLCAKDPHMARWVHFGTTASDVVDTANSLLIREVVRTVRADVVRLEHALVQSGSRNWSMMGRTHGKVAAPTSWGYVCAEHMAEVFEAAKDLDKVGSNLHLNMSGPTGWGAAFGERTRLAAARKLGLRPTDATTQVLPRHWLARTAEALAHVVLACERICLRFRLMAQDGVGELTSVKTEGQKGSSCMPHKINPVRAERVSGLARVVRSNVSVAYEDCLLWCERDISHSSAEREWLPQSFRLTRQILRDTTHVVQTWVPDPKVMRATVESSRDSYTLLCHKILSGSTREEAYNFLSNLDREA